MPRPIIRNTAISAEGLSTQTRTVAAHAATSDLRARMNVARSARYVSLIGTALDAGTHIHDRAKLESLIRAIAEEFPDLATEQFPTAIVAKCYLGEPYEVHTLDLALEIVEHFQRGRPMPGNCERARTLAQHPAYAFVEIYGNAIRAVAKDGRVTTLAAEAAGA